MTIWQFSEYAAWAVSALIAIYLVTDAVRVGRKYDDGFLTHALEDLADELAVEHSSDASNDGVATTDTSPEARPDDD